MLTAQQEPKLTEVTAILQDLHRGLLCAHPLLGPGVGIGFSTQLGDSQPPSREGGAALSFTSKHSGRGLSSSLSEVVWGGGLHRLVPDFSDQVGPLGDVL